MMDRKGTVPVEAVTWNFLTGFVVPTPTLPVWGERYVAPLTSNFAARTPLAHTSSGLFELVPTDAAPVCPNMSAPMYIVSLAGPRTSIPEAAFPVPTAIALEPVLA